MPGELCISPLQNKISLWKDELDVLIIDNRIFSSKLNDFFFRTTLNAEQLKIAEIFHNHFSKKDKLIRLLRNDILKMGHLLDKNYSNLNGLPSGTVAAFDAGLSDELEKFITECNRINKDFTIFFIKVCELSL